MIHKVVISLIAAFCITSSVQAGDVDGSAVIGSMVGAGVGSAVGSATGGKEGAIIGGGVGGAIGAVVGSKNEPVKTATRTTVSTQKVIVVDEGEGHHDNGKHKGHYKSKNKHNKGH